MTRASLARQLATSLDPLTLPKFVEPLVIPPVMPPASAAGGIVNYHIAMRQFRQQILPTGYPMTTVWGYGDDDSPRPGEPGSTYNYPSFTVETRTNQRVRVKWINGLVDPTGNYLAHLLPIDQTLHWANPAGPRDSHGQDPARYIGPVPIVTHVHGAHVPPQSDGYPEAWFLPAANNIPEGYFKQGSHYASVVPTEPGSAVFEYPNDQRASTLWYHDHALGITRANVYAGPAGFWLIRDDVEDSLNLPGPAPRLGDAPGTHYYEIPLAIQDRSFNADGSLFFPSTREYFDGYAGPYAPESEVPPIWNPEFFGNTMLVNGRTWPYLEVEPRLYRFRILNGCNARFLILKFDRPGLKFNVIGTEGGLLPGAPVQLDQLLISPAERNDVLVDFAGLPVGTEITLLNLGPDVPFGGLPVPAADIASPQTTGLVMKFKVVPLTGNGNPGQIPATLPAISEMDPAVETRDVTLNEMAKMPQDIPVMAMLGTGADGPLMWSDRVTERPEVGDTEIWRIVNLTMDAHPIHLHLVAFKVLDRTPFDAMAYQMAQDAYLQGGKVGAPPDPLTYATGPAVPALPWEKGLKDTVIANPNEITRIKATFDIAGRYVWHCHIVDHEDNEMMRPFDVVHTQVLPVIKKKA